ncbi:hypothetical protein [Bacillus phage SPO1L4]|nr:putative small acid-soluble spore protein [Bacillus phage vB_BsuM-Goe9]WIT26501.1 hypothetical protein [Bacillus phage SPO1L4]
MSNNSRNQLVVPEAEQAMDRMKLEIANEFGVNLGADATARQNGSVGGEMTKRMIALAQQQLSGTASTISQSPVQNVNQYH